MALGTGAGTEDGKAPHVDDDESPAVRRRSRSAHSAAVRASSDPSTPTTTTNGLSLAAMGLCYPDPGVDRLPCCCEVMFSHSLRCKRLLPLRAG
jgi:hypothetical protein